MPGPSHRGDLPPDVPSSVPGEYADAYRSAYQRAMHDLEGPAATGGVAEDAGRDRSDRGVASPSSYAGSPAGPPGAVPPGDGPRSTEYRTRPRWLVPVVMAAVALLFIGGAYALGRMVSGGPGSTGSPSSAGASPGGDGPTARQSPTSGTEPGPQPWKGAVEPVEPVKITTACRAPDGVDAAGNKVSYRPGRMADDRADTAWRCKGRAIGERITIHLPAGTKLAEVGLIPGYAKTDPSTDVDRYAENNRITRVTWFLADGTEIEQAMSGNPGDRSMRTVRVPATAGDHLVLRVDQVAKGSRNTTMISELRVAAAAE